MITSTQIELTSHFKTLENVKKLLIVKKPSILSIDLGVTMSKLKSFDYWVEKTSPRYDVRCIVEELLG